MAQGILKAVNVGGSPYSFRLEGSKQQELGKVLDTNLTTLEDRLREVDGSGLHTPIVLFACNLTTQCGDLTLQSGIIPADFFENKSKLMRDKHGQNCRIMFIDFTKSAPEDVDDDWVNGTRQAAKDVNAQFKVFHDHKDADAVRQLTSLCAEAAKMPAVVGKHSERDCKEVPIFLASNRTFVSTNAKPARQDSDASVPTSSLAISASRFINWMANLPWLKIACGLIIAAGITAIVVGSLGIAGIAPLAAALGVAGSACLLGSGVFSLGALRGFLMWRECKKHKQEAVSFGSSVGSQAKGLDQLAGDEGVQAFWFDCQPPVSNP